MLRSLSLFLPAIIPSWNFFDVIAPSPRVEYALLGTPDTEAQDWQLFRPRPARISFLTMLRRLFWNPRWNDSLFVTSCAERLLQDINPDHSEGEILVRLRRGLANTGTDARFLQFRLVFIHREDDTLIRDIEYISRIYPIKEDQAA